MQNNDQNNDPDYKPFTDKELVKVISIVFVFAVYFFIFLKIILLK
jgi:hypothetical protein